MKTLAKCLVGIALFATISTSAFAQMASGSMDHMGAMQTSSKMSAMTSKKHMMMKHSMMSKKMMEKKMMEKKMMSKKMMDKKMMMKKDTMKPSM